MSNSNFAIPKAYNEPVKAYLPGSPEREALKKELDRQASIQVEIPIIIGGKEYHTGNKGKCVMPHDFNHVLAEYNIAGEEELKLAADAARADSKGPATAPQPQQIKCSKKGLHVSILASPFTSPCKTARILRYGATGDDMPFYQIMAFPACG